jgi:predicted ATPase
MRFRSIQLQGFLSFGENAEAVQLGALNVIIGPNGSGKSNFLEAFYLLAAAPRNLKQALLAGGTVEDWQWKGVKNIPTMRIEAIADCDDPLPIRHRFAFSSMFGGNVFKLLEESVASDPGDGRDAQATQFFQHGPAGTAIALSGKPVEIGAVDYDPELLSLAQFRGTAHPELTALAKFYESIRLYRDWRFGRDAPARKPQDAAMPNRWLESDGSNLGLILNRFQRNPPAKKRLLTALRKLYDGIEDFGVLIEGGTVQVFLQEGERTIPAARLSDGTLRFLCLLAVLCDPEPPPVVCIEEPELGLHPDILPTVAELLLDAAERCQLIVTTHSDILVDCMHDMPENILVAEKGEHGTHLRRLDADELKPWLDQYRLGELWTRGDIGGTRW